jgi:hypothetical protein
MITASSEVDAAVDIHCEEKIYGSLRVRSTGGTGSQSV